MKLVIIRGLPGSGKTTIAHLEYREAVRYEADQYFEDDRGNYNYDPKDQAMAHFNCQMNVWSAMLFKFPLITVSNTFTRHSEYAVYLSMARLHGYEVEIRVARGSWDSIHKIPADVIERMRERWEE